MVAAQTLREIAYQETSEDIANPERGFYRARELTLPDRFDVRDENITLIYGKIRADAFRDQPLSDDFLASIQKGFDEARKQGVKVNPRVVYNYGPHPGAKARYGDDAPKRSILTHITQLKPLWEKNMDVINVIDAGFIGGWGEWHTSANELDNPQDRQDILFAILDALPKERMVVQRYPRFKREIFGGSETSADAILTRERAFDGSNLARVGFLNDCFLSSDNDVGTYQNLNEGWALSRELDYIAAESPYVPYGGETCRLHARGNCENTVKEMEKLHINYLNLDYNRQVIAQWQEKGCFEEIRRRIGYRFVLTKARIPESVAAGGVLSIEFEVKNVGFGELFNPRQVEVVLRNNSTSQQVVATIAEEPRFWGAGQTSLVRTKLQVPTSLPGGEYTLGIGLPDVSPGIHDDPRYAIRFANENVWEPSTGINVIAKDLEISPATARGDSTGLEPFVEVRETAR